MKKTLATAIVAALAMLSTATAASAAVTTVPLGVRLAGVTMKCHLVSTGGGGYINVCALHGTLSVTISGHTHVCVGHGTHVPDSTSFSCANHTSYTDTISGAGNGNIHELLTVALGKHTYQTTSVRHVDLRRGEFDHVTCRAVRH